MEELKTNMELFSNNYTITDTDSRTATSLIDDNNSKDYRVGGGEIFGRMLQVIEDAAGEIVQHTKIQGCMGSTT